MYEVTFIEAGNGYNDWYTLTWTLAKCQRYFGKDEFKEVLAGYAPHIVAVKL